MTERWLPIPGYEGRYEISDLGRIWSHHSRRVLKTPCGGHGYPNASFWDSVRRKTHTYTLHTLVALTFHGPKPPNTEVRHLNGVRTDCRANNLAYGTRLENEADKRRHGTHEKRKRTVCPLGHRLAPPNLVLGALKRRQRNCMACARGRRTVFRAAQRGVTLDLKAEAKRHYHAIMASSSEAP